MTNRGRGHCARRISQNVRALVHLLMRPRQQRRNTSGVKVKKEKSNAVNIKNPDYSEWCFMYTGRKWNNHSETTCHNKKTHRGQRRRRRRKKEPHMLCLRVNGTSFAKDRPLLANVRTMMASENPKVPEIKRRPTLPPATIPKCPPSTGFPHHRTPCLRCHVHVRRHVNVGHAHVRPL